MKKLLFLFVLGTLSATAQQSITFKTAYKPGMVYNQKSVQTAKVEVSYKADEELLAMLEAQGIKNPTITEEKTTTLSVATTGKPASGEIPVSMKVSVDTGKETKLIPDNTIIKGNIKANGMPEFTSVESDMDPAMKEIFMKGLQASMSQIILPERKVKVGESFTANQPLSIPVGPAMMNINDTAVYKLVKVEGKKAYFDVSHTYSIDSEISGQQMKGNGFGTAKLVHDVDANFPIKQDLNMTMTMGFNMQGIDMSIKSDTVMSIECTVATAK